jgi:VanZ family protein
MTDETIQYFTQRGSRLLDVWLDFSGALTAIIIFYFIYKLIKNKRHTQKGRVQ